MPTVRMPTAISPRFAHSTLRRGTMAMRVMLHQGAKRRARNFRPRPPGIPSGKGKLRLRVRGEERPDLLPPPLVEGRHVASAMHGPELHRTTGAAGPARHGCLGPGDRRVEVD